MDLIRCPQCGEQYSSSYPRCPFCEEEDDRPRRIKYSPKRHIADKRKTQSARGGLIVVLIAVLALLSWYLFGDGIGKNKQNIKPDDKPAAQGVEPAIPASNPNADPFFDSEGGGTTPSGTAPSGETPSVPETPSVEPQPAVDENVDVSGAKLNREDFTLGYAGEKFTIKLSGTEATPTWSVDNPNVATIGSDGTVTAVANGNTTVHCKVGKRDLTCTVRVRNTGKTAAAAEAPMVAEPIVPTAPAKPESTAPGGQETKPQTPAQEPKPSTPAQEPKPQTPSTGATHVDASALSVKTNYGTKLQKDPGTGYPDCTVRIGGDLIALSVVGTDTPVSSWTSDKTSVVTVSSDGKLTPVSVGTAHVTATVGDASITCIIRVR